MDRTVYYNTESCSTASDQSSYQSSPITSSRVRNSREQIKLNNVFQMRQQRRDTRSSLLDKGHQQNHNHKGQKGLNPKADASYKDVNKQQRYYSIPKCHARGAVARKIVYKKTDVGDGGSVGGLSSKILQSGISRVAIPCNKDREDIEFQYRTVLVLHLQCKSIFTMTPGALDPFVNLKNLYLYKNNIRRIQGLDALSNLELLDMSRNNLERIDNLNNCKRLKKLYLGFNEIQVVEGLEGLTSLEELHVDDQDVPPEQPIIFSPGIMASVAHCLIILDLSSNQLRSLEPIAGLPVLRTLMAADNRFSDFDSLLETLESLRQLHVLTLKGNPIASKPNYKSKVIGAVYQLEVLDGKDINDTTRACVQKLRLMKEYRARQMEEADLLHKMKQEAEEQTRQNSHHFDLGNSGGDFTFSTPTRLSPLPLPPPKTTKTSKSSLPYGSSSRTPDVSDSEDIYSTSNGVIDSSSYDSRARNPADDEFLTEVADAEQDEMSDMAKIIFRLSNLDEVGPGGDGSNHPVKMKHSNYWEFPGSSLPRECRPLSPLEDPDHISGRASSSSSPKNKELYLSASAAEIVGHHEKKSTSGSARPKPAAPGGRHCSNNTSSRAGGVSKSSSVDFTLSSNAIGTQSPAIQQTQRHFYGRTLSPLMELPTPESLTARDEHNE